MSRTFELSDAGSSILKADYYPPIELDPAKNYGLGLVGFYGCNSINNISEKNNSIGFYYEPSGGSVPQRFTLQVPPGAYEIEEINSSLRRQLYWKLHSVVGTNNLDDIFTLQSNNNTLKCEIYSLLEVDFAVENSIGPLLGFNKDKYAAGRTHESTNLVDIVPVRLIRLECNVVSGSYINNSEQHSIFTFDIDVEPGFRLTKEPHNIIYLPISPQGRRSIDNITVSIVSEKGELINFGPEATYLILELKELK